MTNTVYISDIGSFLPNKAINNDEMEHLLGMVGNMPSRTRKIILRNNGIKERYYALNPESGAITHTNAQITAEAIRILADNQELALADCELLCCGTSSPDQLMPSHGSMVHGELGCPPLEVAATTGVCLAGIAALKYVVMAVASGMARQGIATGSETASTFMRVGICGAGSAERAAALEKNPQLAFEADFLRWMLSDGAGACLLTTNKPRNGLALRVDWLEMTSHAHRFAPCMYAGAVKEADGRLKGWREFTTLAEAVAVDAFAVKQDAKLLNREIISFLTVDAFAPLITKYQLRAEKIDWFLPHYSSAYFRQPVADGFAEIGFAIDQERWFTNLVNKGNTGSASIYIMLAELFHSGRLQQGQTILCMIPESSRFSCGYLHLTVC